MSQRQITIPVAEYRRAFRATFALSTAAERHRNRARAARYFDFDHAFALPRPPAECLRRDACADRVPQVVRIPYNPRPAVARLLAVQEIARTDMPVSVARVAVDALGDLRATVERAASTIALEDFRATHIAIGPRGFEIGGERPMSWTHAEIDAAQAASLPLMCDGTYVSFQGFRCSCTKLKGCGLPRCPAAFKRGE